MCSLPPFLFIDGESGRLSAPLPLLFGCCRRLRRCCSRGGNSKLAPRVGKLRNSIEEKGKKDEKKAVLHTKWS